MAEVGMPLLIHGEVTTAGVDIFDKEARFIEEVIKVSALAASLLLSLRSAREGNTLCQASVLPSC